VTGKLGRGYRLEPEMDGCILVNREQILLMISKQLLSPSSPKLG
jgi:hypothetical protein